MLSNSHFSSNFSSLLEVLLRDQLSLPHFQTQLFWIFILKYVSRGRISSTLVLDSEKLSDAGALSKLNSSLNKSQEFFFDVSSNSTSDLNITCPLPWKEGKKMTSNNSTQARTKCVQTL